MFLKAKKKRYLTVTCHEAVLYEGYWTELPLAEEFFNDKEPCAIHRGAVHLRLLAELEQLFSSSGFQSLFCLYTGFPSDCSIQFSEK